MEQQHLARQVPTGNVQATLEGMMKPLSLPAPSPLRMLARQSRDTLTVRAIPAWRSPR